MANKTFIAYKYSEARNLRDEILKSLGDDAVYYQGETAESPDISSTTVENIKKNLTSMIHGTSVTIVVVSPELKESNWVDWEIAYSLKEVTRADRTSRTNGVVGVIMKIDGGYDWLVSTIENDDGCSVRNVDSSKLYPIVNKNRYNLKGDDKYSCTFCQTFSQLEGSFISLIDEDSFLGDPERYIENAFKKCENVNSFEITKTL